MTEREFDISSISGNASDVVKGLLGDPSFLFSRSPLKEPKSPIFGATILKRVVVTEISVLGKVEEPGRLEGRVVCEITVEEDMINGGGNIHGGCSAFLIDVCSSMALAALNITNTGNIEGTRSVSQSLNLVYHSPAALGDRLRLVNTTVTVGARAHSARTEIWNKTHHRLVSSGVHIKMLPSPPKANL